LPTPASGSRNRIRNPAAGGAAVIFDNDDGPAGPDARRERSERRCRIGDEMQRIREELPVELRTSEPGEVERSRKVRNDRNYRRRAALPLVIQLG